MQCKWRVCSTKKGCAARGEDIQYEGRASSTRGRCAVHDIQTQFIHGNISGKPYSDAGVYHTIMGIFAVSLLA